MATLILDIRFWIMFMIITAEYLSNAQAVTKKRRRRSHGSTRYYNPNFGLEVYWPGGDWKIMEKTTIPPGGAVVVPQETTTPFQLCGDDCPEAFRNITEVCAMAAMATNDQGFFSQLFTGYNYAEIYKTMTYCQFMKESNPRCKFSGWVDVSVIFVHIGPCMTNVFQQHRTPAVLGGTHPTDYTPDVFELGPVNRMTKFLSKFYDPVEWTKYYPGLPYPVEPFENVDK